MPDPTPQNSKCAIERNDPAPSRTDRQFENWPGNVRFTAPLFFNPGSRGELANAILQAEQAGHRVRAFGSKWSFSDAVCATTGDRPGAMIATEHLNKNLDAELGSILAAGVVPDRLCHVEAGRKARELLDDLAARGLMLEAGGASGQSVGGMMATSTHSSESSVAPFVDQVRAIHLIGAGGIEHWIERDQPITDPALLQGRYPCLAAGNIRYDTKLFHAVLVSAGSMGVIYSVIVEAAPAFGFRRHRFATTWERLLAEDPALTAVMSGNYMLSKFSRGRASRVGSGDILGQPSFMDHPFTPNVFSQIVINPYPFYVNDRTLTAQEQAAIGHHLCFVTNRVRIPISSVGTPAPVDSPGLDEIGTQMGWAALFALRGRPLGWTDGKPVYPPDGLGDVVRFGLFQDSIAGQPVSARASALVDFLAREYQPGTISAALHYLLASIMPLGDVVESKTSEVMAWNDKDKLRGFCVEAAFPISAGITYTQQVLDMVAEHAERSPRVYVGGYLALRITGKTEALLGMQRWSPTIHVEYMGIAETGGLRAFVNELQTRAIALGGVLHFGLENDAMTAADLRASFGSEAIETFRWARGVFSHNGTLNTFDNSFTERLGLSARKTDLSYLVPLLLSGT
jgi:hypothetical protein